MAKAFDSEQQRVAGQLLAEAQRFGAGPRATKALLLAGYVESGLRNLPYGDRDSLGVLQQRPSQGWKNPRNVPKAADAFLQHALRLNATGRYRTAGQLAQAVQRSAFPDRYDAAAPAIRNLLSGVKGSGGGIPGVGGSVGSVTVPGASGTASTPAGSDGALALVQALSQQRPQIQSAPLAAPAFSAAPVLPAGYQAPQSGGVSTPPVDTAALLSAIRTQGGDTPGQAAGSSMTVGGSSSTGATGAGRMRSKGLASFDGKPVRQDFAAQLAWARKHGWNGTVTSGFRTKAQQIAAAKSYGLQHYGPAGPLGSNHVYGHAGAVDVTDPGRLNAILDRYPGKRTLIWAGPIIGDKPHFSPTGH